MPDNKYVGSVLFVAAILTLSTVLSSPVQFAAAQYYPTVELEWTPAKPTPDQEVTFTITFKITGSHMPRPHVDYTFTISKDGTTVYTVSQHAWTGTDTIKQKLASDGVYKITVTITGVGFEAVQPESSDFSLTVEKPALPEQELRLITIPRGERPVEIDGLWTTKTEWTDASEAKIKDDESMAYLRAKHDGAFAYILLDFISDDGLDRSSDLAVACFDTRSNGGNSPLADDYCFYRITRADKFLNGIIQGNGEGWTILQESEMLDLYDVKFDAAVGYSHVNDPYDSTNKHVIYEFRIPIDAYGLDEMMKFYVYLNDAFNHKFIEWPASADGKEFKSIVKNVLPSPDEWGDLHLKLGKESDLSAPQVRLGEEEKVEVRVQAKQIKDLVIVRLRNMDDSTEDIYAFKILLPDVLLHAFKGSKEWSKEGLADNGAIFSTLTKPVRPGDKEYFLLRVDADYAKPLIQWIVYGSDKSELAAGSVTPFSLR